MSESTSRAERRALRRVAGVEILGVVQDQHAAVQTLQAGLHSQQDRLTAQAQEIASLRQQQGATWNSLVEFCGRSWRGRVRWLLTGR